MHTNWRIGSTDLQFAICRFDLGNSYRLHLHTQEPERAPLSLSPAWLLSRIIYWKYCIEALSTSDDRGGIGDGFCSMLRHCVFYHFQQIYFILKWTFWTTFIVGTPWLERLFQKLSNQWSLVRSFTLLQRYFDCSSENIVSNDAHWI